MPSYKYGGRQFQISGNPATASTTANLVLQAWEYLPAVSAQQAVDGAAEGIKSATLLFVTSVAQANSTAAGGSVIVAATQYNSAGASQNSATLYSQAAASQAAVVPIDVTARLSGWVLTPGDTIVLGLNTNTVGIPASFPGLILSGTIDTVTAA